VPSEIEVFVEYHKEPDPSKPDELCFLSAIYGSFGEVLMFV
jgi:hypothetical protein